MCVELEFGLSGATDLQHEGVRRVHKDGAIFLWRGLQAELSIGGFGVIGEGDGAGQLAII